MAAQHPGDTDPTATVAARLDSLAWRGFHTRVLVALGITWILDGLEVTLAGALAGALQASPTLALTDAQIGQSASAYLAGAVLGALGFGWATDRLGRKRLFFVTLGVYLAGTAATALSFDFLSFAACRFVTGAGIGGEYAAINSAIQELIPARYRGRTDLGLNGSFWVGAAIGAIGASLLLAPGVFGADTGWRVAFGIGAVLGAAILWMRRLLPESPRWLVGRGREREAQAIVDAIEGDDGRAARNARADGSRRSERVERSESGERSERPERPERPEGAERHGPPGAHRPPPSAPPHAGLRDVLRVLLRVYPRRTGVGLALMSAQAFCYNAVFFTYALVLGRFYDVPPDRVGLYLLPMAAGNFLGPLVLGRWFDTLGRRTMIPATYALSGLLLLANAWLFARGGLGLAGQALAWTVVFFFASAAASAAYLTVGETFPLQIRALAIALFYAFGTALGGVAGPWLFGTLIGTGDRVAIGWGYAFGGALMLAAAAVHRRWGVDAERRSLEELAAGP